MAAALTTCFTHWRSIQAELVAELRRNAERQVRSDAEADPCHKKEHPGLGTSHAEPAAHQPGPQK